MALRPFSSSLALALALAGCSRTPPEPAPAASTTEVAPRRTVAETTTTSRCIAKWPSADKAPAIPSPSLACPPDPEPNLKLQTAELAFVDRAGPELKIQVELAKSTHDVTRGLMFRREMGDDHGMLFKLEGHTDHVFWMQNTCIPLDMMFVDDDGVIVGIVEGAEPLTETGRSVGCPSSFVLEVNGGWSRKHGVAPGQKIAIPQAAR
jgi:uncharacterized membrane protein (UPF0127 family)